MKSILITGVGGFIGRALARHFKRDGYQVYGMDRLHAENAPQADLHEYIQVELPSGRFADFLQKRKVDAVLHCAGRASVSGAMEDPYSDFYGGPVLTFALLASLRDLQPECAFINISSAAVYGNPSELPVKEGAPIRPISSYGFHKWQSEIICQEYASLWGIRTASARIFSAYGPGLHRQVIWDIIYKILTQPEVLLQGTGQESRDFIHVQDIAQGVNVIVNNASMKGEAYNLASGSETKIKDLATLIQARLNAQVEIKFSGELPAGTPINWKADIQKINVLGFSPQMTLEKGINDFIEWARREIGG